MSSSAAVEVATMSALCAAYGIPLEGRRLALLCQQVENHIVGACCTTASSSSSSVSGSWGGSCRAAAGSADCLLLQQPAS